MWDLIHAHLSRLLIPSRDLDLVGGCGGRWPDGNLVWAYGGSGTYAFDLTTLERAQLCTLPSTAAVYVARARVLWTATTHCIRIFDTIGHRLLGEIDTCQLSITSLCYDGNEDVWATVKSGDVYIFHVFTEPVKDIVFSKRDIAVSSFEGDVKGMYKGKQRKGETDAETGQETSDDDILFTGDVSTHRERESEWREMGMSLTVGGGYLRQVITGARVARQRGKKQPAPMLEKAKSERGGWSCSVGHMNITESEEEVVEDEEHCMAHWGEYMWIAAKGGASIEVWRRPESADTADLVGVFEVCDECSTGSDLEICHLANVGEEMWVSLQDNSVRVFHCLTRAYICDISGTDSFRCDMVTSFSKYSIETAFVVDEDVEVAMHLTNITDAMQVVFPLQ